MNKHHPHVRTIDSYRCMQTKRDLTRKRSIADHTNKKKVLGRMAREVGPICFDLLPDFFFLLQLFFPDEKKNSETQSSQEKKRVDGQGRPPHINFRHVDG
jgi:hypothetical protein